MKGYTPISKVTSLGVDPATLRRWCASGKVPARKVGKKWFVHMGGLLRQYRLMTESIAHSAQYPDQ